MRKTVILILFAACAAAPAKQPAPQAQPVQKATPAAALADRAGDSVETAVAVPTNAPNEGIDFENNWIYDRFGKFRRRGGGTGTVNGRRYDVVEIELWGGEQKKVFFDITENWKNWKPQQ